MNYGDSIVDELKKKEKEAQQANEKFIVNVKKCFAAAVAEKDGLSAFKIIKRFCLWDEPYSQTTMESELYKKARRDVWLLIRKYIPDKKLAEIEIFDKTDIFEELGK